MMGIFCGRSRLNCACQGIFCCRLLRLLLNMGDDCIGTLYLRDGGAFGGFQRDRPLADGKITAPNVYLCVLISVVLCFEREFSSV